MSAATSLAGSAIYRWRSPRLEVLDYCDMAETSVLVADSFLVDENRTLALDLHRRRFTDAAAHHVAISDVDAFWRASLALVPASGAWFPRLELQDRAGSRQLVYRHRPAPARSRSVVLATAPGADLREHPTIKGPDLVAMARLRQLVRPLGADEAVILSPDGHVVEGAYSALLWWRGDVLVAPSPGLARIDSVTERSVLTLATALGVEVHHDSVTPTDLDGLEVWALSALHGIRIVTSWVDGPLTAELPGRLALWRERLGRLSRPVATVQE